MSARTGAQVVIVYSFADHLVTQRSAMNVSDKSITQSVSE
jgi:hypothetical protein